MKAKLMSVKSSTGMIHVAAVSSLNINGLWDRTRCGKPYVEILNTPTLVTCKACRKKLLWLKRRQYDVREFLYIISR